jgi:hypothetical protein
VRRPNETFTKHTTCVWAWAWKFIDKRRLTCDDVCVGLNLWCQKHYKSSSMKLAGDFIITQLSSYLNNSNQIVMIWQRRYDNLWRKSMRWKRFFLSNSNSSHFFSHKNRKPKKNKRVQDILNLFVHAESNKICQTHKFRSTMSMAANMPHSLGKILNT